jgi:hypothetical protein
MNAIHDEAQTVLIQNKIKKINDEQLQLNETIAETITSLPQDEVFIIRTIQVPEELDDLNEYDVHNLEEYKKDLAWLKHAEQIALKAFSKPGLRKLSQLSNKTLQQFLREKIHYTTRDAIRKEIDKRHASIKLYKNMKTVLLQQWYEDTHSLEIYNELERRKRVKEIGSFSTCTDTQLQNAIRINATHIKMNAMSTRTTNKERTKRYTDDTQTFTRTKRIKARHAKKVTATTTGANEHKDNFEANHHRERKKELWFKFEPKKR